MTQCEIVTRRDRAIDSIPKKLLDEIEQFVVDRGTGNIILNIKDGKIVGLRAERILSPD